MNEIASLILQRSLLGDLLSSQTKKEDAPESAHAHLMTAIYLAWVREGKKPLETFSKESQELLTEAKEYMECLVPSLENLQEPTST
jgi:hypothetical protein